MKIMCSYVFAGGSEGSDSWNHFLRQKITTASNFLLEICIWHHYRGYTQQKLPLRGSILFDLNVVSPQVSAVVL